MAIKGETPLERLRQKIARENPCLWIDEDDVLIYHDLASDTLHMIEIRAFDVTGLKPAERAKLMGCSE